jgi:hypothetical protein
MSPYLTLGLAVVFVCFGSILVRWAADSSSSPPSALSSAEGAGDLHEKQPGHLRRLGGSPEGGESPQRTTRGVS